MNTVYISVYHHFDGIMGKLNNMKISTYFRCEEANKIKRSLKFKFIIIIKSVNVHNSQKMEEKRNSCTLWHFSIKYMDVLMMLCIDFLAVCKYGIKLTY